MPKIKRSKRLKRTLTSDNMKLNGEWGSVKKETKKFTSRRRRNRDKRIIREELSLIGENV